MRKIVLLLILSISIVNCASDENSNDGNNQNEFVGDVILKFQQDVDDFALNNYTIVTGRFQIGQTQATTNSITNISNLIDLTTINGHLLLTGNSSLTSLNGLNNITSVLGTLSVHKNNNLTNLSGLNNINSVGNLQVDGNENLVNISDLSNIASVNGYLQANYIFIEKNPKLTNLNGLDNITTFNGSLNIEHNDLFENLNGLNGITTIKSLVIACNNMLTNLDGLNNINSDTGNIIDNTSLTDLCGIQTIATSGFVIYGNAYNPSTQDFIDGNCSQ